MSADNGIYILSTMRSRRETRPGVSETCAPHKVYRVAHAQAIDNFSWFEKYQPHNMGAYMRDVWGDSAVYEKKAQALSHASELAKLFIVLEYGIVSIDTTLIFYGDA